MLDPNNPIFNQMFGGYNNFQAAFNPFVQQVMQGMNGVNVDEQIQFMIQQKLNSGEISQQQFESVRQTVNQLTGMNR